MRKKDSVQWVIDRRGHHYYAWEYPRENRMSRMKSSTLIILTIAAIGILVICVESKSKSSFQTLDLRTEDRWQPDTSVRKSQSEVLSKKKLDPQKTWKFFQRSAARNERKSKKASRHLKSAPLYAQGPAGPPGPRGVRGLRGPQGTNVTKEEMVQIVHEVFRDAAEKGVRKGPDTKCAEICLSNLDGNSTGPQLPNAFDVGQNVVIPKVASAFMWELTDHVIVQRKSFTELQRFHRGFAMGGYQRDRPTAEHIESGRFVAPMSGFYTFFVRLHLHLRFSDAELAGNMNSELFSVLLCIESLCQKNMNLESISWFGAGHRTTVSISGMLFLKENQYVSVFLDNSSRHGLKVFQGSQFSGFLIGV